MKRLITILFICFLGLIESYSCSCDLLSFEDATEWADEIFLGRIVQIREIETYQESDGRSETRIWGALFEVEKKWKGSNKKNVEVFQSHTSCDYSFKFPSRPYIVYAKKSELIEWDSTRSFVGLGTWLCARNADAYTYNLDDEYGFDDREKLDKKFGEPIKLSRFNYKRIWLGITLLILTIALLIGRKLKKRKGNTL